MCVCVCFFHRKNVTQGHQSRAPSTFRPCYRLFILTRNIHEPYEDALFGNERAVDVFAQDIRAYSHLTEHKLVADGEIVSKLTTRRGQEKLERRYTKSVPALRSQPVVLFFMCDERQKKLQERTRVRRDYCISAG